MPMFSDSSATSPIKSNGFSFKSRMYFLKWIALAGTDPARGMYPGVYETPGRRPALRRAIVTLAILLAVPAAAQAGGWATVGLSSLPEGTPPGGSWDVELTVLQHGRTPLEGVDPAVIVRDRDGARTRFEAKPTGEPGVYRAEVEFPRAGEYTYAVDDGFVGAVHTYPPVTIGAAASVPPAPADGTPWAPIAAAAAAVALLAAAVVASRRLLAT